VDREMALSESTLSKLKKKQEELEQTASKPARAEEPEETVPRHRSLAQCVYAENRKKISMDNKRQMQASSAHAVLSHLGPPVLYPLYNQPQDTEIYHENIRRHRTFRKRLAEHIRKLKLEAEKREDALAEAYSRRAADWLRRVERIEQGQKRKAKDARNREFFEKVFPELRKQREERERFNRLGARVKSEAELEEIADGLHEQEHEDKKMRSLTVVPPLLRDPSDTTPVYIDTNRRCMDMEAEHKELQLRNVWSQAERELFREKYLQHPKNFGQIASFLPRKSVRDCVRFYYLSKKAENYKQLLRKPRQRRSARNPPRAQPEPELPAGVTTRLQRSQAVSLGTTARTENKEQSMEESMPQVTDPVTCIPIPTAAPAQPPRSELTRTPPLPPSPPPASSAPTPVTSTPTPLSVAGSPAAAPTPPAVDVPLPPATTAEVTLTITPVSAVHYGLKEEAVGARVCEACHSRCVRSRYTRCPVPTCPGPKVSPKRLRHLPPRWHDLSLEQKRPLMEEFEIPSELSKCCFVCHKTITKRLEALVEGGSAPEPTEEEAARFRALLREHGTAWDRIAAVSGRTPASLKAFYFTYRRKLQLDTLVADRPASARCSSSEDSALSSADTDTASGGSPARAPPAQPAPAPRTDAVAPRRPRRDEYDSSATETADEENDAPSAKIVPPTSIPTAVSAATSCSPVTVVSSGTTTVPVVNRMTGAPQTVRDVVLNLIEISLTKDMPSQHPGIKHQIKVTSACASGREALATLSVVNSSHVGAAGAGGAASPQRAATITPVAHVAPSNDKDVYRNSTEYRPQQERESPNQYNSKPKTVGAPPRPQVKASPNPKGSITLGTPVETRFEPHRNPPEPKTGSITAGTPVHPHHLPDKRTLEFYKRRSPGGPGAYYAATSSQPRPQSPSFSPTGYTRNPYGPEQRQIIMADFITSQQMHSGARRDRERAASPQGARGIPAVPTTRCPISNTAPLPSTCLPTPASAAAARFMAQKFPLGSQFTLMMTVVFQQMMDRRVQSQPQYIERDRQLQMQRRDAIVFLLQQNLTNAADNYVVIKDIFLGILNECLVNFFLVDLLSNLHCLATFKNKFLINASYSVSSQDGERRMIQSVTYSTPGKPRAQTPHHIDRKDANRFTVGNSEGYVAGSAEEWKRRDAPKHAPYLEPVSPPDNHPANRNNSNRRYSCVGSSSVGVGVGVGSGVGGSGAGGGVLTAFDYVTNRIVEVMRSDADERAKPLAFPTTAYAYPYSALNVQAAGDGEFV
ncbi:hypothetical protein HW555_012109, partial [Spodoptera exigua]